MKAFGLVVVETVGPYALHLRHNAFRAVLHHRGVQSTAVQHVEDFKIVRHLHGWCSLVGIAGHDIGSQTFQRYDEFFSELTRTE